MVKNMLAATILLTSLCSFGQLSSSSEFEGKRAMPIPQSYRQAGLLEASATFSPSTMLSRKAINFYVSAFAEYHFDRRVSLRSDNYLFLNSLETNSFVNNAVRSYFGVFYHFNQNPFSNLDLYIGFQPGITAMSKGNYPEPGVEYFAPIEPSRTILSPSFSFSTGVKFYVWKYFNFFANVNYLNSSMGGVPDGPHNTDEIVFSAGLGFQINTKKK